MTRQMMSREQAKAAGGCRRVTREACRLIRMSNGQSSTRPKKPRRRREPRRETSMRRAERAPWTLLRARLRPRTASPLTANQLRNPATPRALVNLPANRVISHPENPLASPAIRALERAMESLATRAPERALENLWANLSTERAPRARREQRDQRDQRVPWTRRRRLPDIAGWSRATASCLRMA